MMKLILASNSPRRQQLLQQMGYTFEIRTKEMTEIVPSHLSNAQDVVSHICEEKARSYRMDLLSNEVLITADTMVEVDNMLLGKPNNRQEAIEMLQRYSAKTHQVMTAVCIIDQKNTDLKICSSKVFVRRISTQEITYYVDNYRPYDKAGGYGIQEWFGAVAVEKIEGSFNNVMGFPTHLVHQMLIANYPNASFSPFFIKR